MRGWRGDAAGRCLIHEAVQGDQAGKIVSEPGVTETAALQVSVWGRASQAAEATRDKVPAGFRDQQGAGQWEIRTKR